MFVWTLDKKVRVGNWPTLSQCFCNKYAIVELQLPCSEKSYNMNGVQVVEMDNEVSEYSSERLIGVRLSSPP